MSFFSNKLVKRFIGVAAVMAVLTVMTGTAGSATAAPTTGLHGSFMERVSYFGLFAGPRWMVMLTLTVFVFLIANFFSRFGFVLRRQIAKATDVQQRVMARPGMKGGAIALVIVLALLVPKIVTQGFWQYLLVEQVGVWILLALGLNVVVGFTGLLDLGFAAFYAIGAYVTAWETGVLPMPAFMHHTIPTLWAIPIGIGAAMIFGILLGTPTLRLRGDYLAIVTLGFALIIDDFVETQSGITGGGTGTKDIPHFALNLGFTHFQWGLDPIPYYYLCLFFVGLFIMAFLSLEHSRVGRAWVAIREDEVAAESIGINPLKYKVMAFAVGAASGGFGGVLTGGLVGFVTPTLFQYQVSVNVLVLVIFGGMGSVWGVAAGAVVLQVITSYLDNYQPWGYQLNDLYMYIGALLIVMMIFRPAGLFPSKRRRREFKEFETNHIGHLDEVLTGEEV
jgi:branched-chain amino acid transport system permease protein